MAQSLYKPPLTPLSAVTAAGARRLLDDEQRHKETPDQGPAWSLTPKQAVSQPNVASFGHQSKNARQDLKSTNKSLPQSNSLAKARVGDGTPTGTQAQVNQDFVHQLNRTEEALQKFRRAASNYRENAYRIQVMDQTDGRGHGLPQEYPKQEALRPVGRYGPASKSLPRYAPGAGSGYGSSHEYSLDLQNCSM